MTQYEKKILNQFINKDIDGEQILIDDVVVDNMGNRLQVYFDKDEGGFYAGTTPLSAFYIQHDGIRKYSEVLA